MAKTDFLTADMTRRQFMKISGKSLAGLTLSASMLSLFGCSQKQVDAGAVATWALPQGLLVVNADLCTGCQRCEINCTLTNDGVCSSYISRVKIPRLLARLAGGPVESPMLAGKEFTEYAGDAAAVVHCGACAITRGQMLARLDEARAQGLPMTNYGMCISLAQGVLERVLSPFPEALAAWRAEAQLPG